MANTVSGKLPTSGNVIYDSGNDTPTGKKRAVLPGGGVSVAERARLFGTQIKVSSASKAPKSPNQRPPLNNQPTKSNIIHQDRNYQPRQTDVDRRRKQDTSYSTTQRVPNNYRPPAPNNDRTRRKQPSSPDQRNYSRVTQSYNHNQHSPTRQRPVLSYDTFQYITPQKQSSNKANYTQIIPSDSYTSDDDSYLDSYNRQKPLPRTTVYQTSNYFQPIRDPLEVLYEISSQGYSQQNIPVTNDTNTNGLQPFDLGNLINRIQQDYLNNVRPYVSSVEFIENEQSLANIGFITPATNRKDYTRQIDNRYQRRVPPYYYDIIDRNDFNPYENQYSKQSFTNNQYSSIKRRKHRIRYHDQALSPIHVLESSNTTNTQHQPENSSATTTPKPPTPVATGSNEEEEEEATTTVTQTEISKPTESETSSDATSESEDESPKNTSTIPATQSTEVIRPTLPNQTPSTIVRTPARKSETEESETEESDTESESDTDDEDADEKPKPKPSPIVRSNNLRTVGTPQINTRVTPQQTTNNNNNTNQPSESSNLQNTEKSSLFRNKLQSITNKFRRKKSSIPLDS